MEFALAVFAYWIGPWKNDLKVLKCFSSINHFKQMLIRAAIRMPLISYELKRAEDNERYRQATKLIIQYVKN
ncbi:MAG: hypothetical protein M1342_03895 [Patescibacteria group bacterium]|nr:hypothetical protein [Patescibacteria group bacterium]